MIQIYTGDGKGKTTAAIGLAVRAQSSFRVLFVQFLKDGQSSEIEGLKMLPNVDIEVFGNGSWVKGAVNREQEELVVQGFNLLAQKSNNYDVIIADEVITAVNLKIVTEKDVLNFLKGAIKEKEYVLTGRGATKKMIAAADLVTEMKKIKHYFDAGIAARDGIEY
ncbi:MAG: cob(I)yrinic acid a,c-diamide adenosyltransferase [Patescibacteria group bacterium]|nr:cob(I)yrinic acid a,c-diamide adenosyltransferase [Patescibacteria group bacterium]